MPQGEYHTPTYKHAQREQHDLTPSQAISHVFVNIRQFLEAKNKPEDVLFFRNVYDLSEYTKDKHMFFPRRQLEKGSPLRQLLKQIH